MNDSLISLSYALASTKMITYPDKVAILDIPFPELLEELKNYNPMNRKNEIKRALYREKPMAKYYPIWKSLGKDYDYVDYRSELADGTQVHFRVPKEEHSDLFTGTMPALLLIKWMVDFFKITVR